MKIVHCLAYFLPYSIGGTEVYVHSLAKGQQLLGHDVQIILPFLDRGIPKNYEYDGIKILGYTESKVATRSMIFGEEPPKGIPEFLELLKNEMPDIVHFHEISNSHGFGKYHLEAIILLGLKSIYTIHIAIFTCKTGNLYYCRKEKCDGIMNINKCSVCFLYEKGIPEIGGKIIAGLGVFPSLSDLASGKFKTVLREPKAVKWAMVRNREIFNNCNKIIVLSNWYRDILIANNYPTSKIKYIPQGLPTSQKYSDRKKSNSSLDLVFVGRITPIKGIDLLIKAMNTLIESNCTLSILAPKLDNKFVSYCKDLSRENINIFWKGTLLPNQIEEELQNYDALILPSICAEMAPLVIEQAFAVGIPVLGSDHFGIAEAVIHNVNGLLFEPNNEKAMVDSIEQLLFDTTLLSKLKQGIRKPRSFQNIVEETIATYEEVL